MYHLIAFFLLQGINRKYNNDERINMTCSMKNLGQSFNVPNSYFFKNRKYLGLGLIELLSKKMVSGFIKNI
jgi:hypothetical protein